MIKIVASLLRSKYDELSKPHYLGRFLSSMVLILAVWASSINAQEGVRFSAIKTAESAGSLEAMVVTGGRWLSIRNLSHSAILVQHPEGDLLYDTGIGREVEAQMEVFNILDQQLFAIQNHQPAREQLDAVSYPIERLRAIVVGHMHWDHVSGLEDFLEVPVWVPAEALAEARAGEPPGFVSSQFDHPDIRWQDFTLKDQSYLGFDKSLDVFGDGTVILVDLSGHADGQVGMFVHVTGGRQLFLIGDTTWAIEGVLNQQSRPKFVQWMTGVDKDYERNARLIERIYQLTKHRPDIEIIPAHDENVLKGLPQFPMMSDGERYQR